MVSTRLATIIAIAAFAAGGFVMSPVPQVIAAVIATDVKCTGCVGTTDMGGNAVTSLKIKENDVKAQDLAPDSVGGSELQGVTKLLFASCPFEIPVEGSHFGGKNCTVNGAKVGDHVITTMQNSWTKSRMPVLYSAYVSSSNVVTVIVEYDTFGLGPRTLPISVIVYSKQLYWLLFF